MRLTANAITAHVFLPTWPGHVEMSREIIVPALVRYLRDAVPAGRASQATSARDDAGAPLSPCLDTCLDLAVQAAVASGTLEAPYILTLLTHCVQV